MAYIYSAWYFCELTTLLLAPIAAGRVFDLTGNYDQTLALLAASALVALGLAVLAMRRPGLQRAVRPSSPADTTASESPPPA
jgi:hypothetical protein